jgi:ubiquinone biosynthesis protein UbiJ
MSIANTVQDLNRQLARRINEEARSNPQSPYANKFVGIANGQVVVVADELDDLARRLRQVEPDPTKTVSVEASRDYTVVEEIWGLR